MPFAWRLCLPFVYACAFFALAPFASILFLLVAKISHNRQKYNVDIYRHFKELQKIREQALENGSYSAAVQAEVARGKAAGLYVEQKIIKHGKLDQLTEEELDEKIGELMREMKIVDGELIDDAKKIN